MIVRAGVCGCWVMHSSPPLISPDQQENAVGVNLVKSSWPGCKLPNLRPEQRKREGGKGKVREAVKVILHCSDLPEVSNRLE